MVRIVAILASSALVGYLYYRIHRYLHHSAECRRYFVERPALHPNWICAWRTMLSMVGILIYFVIGSDIAVASGVFIFTLASYMDGLDGLVARTCGLESEFGKWIDPLCDKISYITPIFIFAYYGLVSLELLIVFTFIEFAGQFGVRSLLKRYKYSVAANKIGKYKAVLCFALVIYLVILHGRVINWNFANYLLILLCIMSFLSAATKFPLIFYTTMLGKIPKVIARAFD